MMMGKRRRRAGFMEVVMHHPAPPAREAFAEVSAVQAPAGSWPREAPARCLHLANSLAEGAPGCPLTWCDAPWSSGRTGCPVA